MGSLLIRLPRGFCAIATAFTLLAPAPLPGQASGTYSLTGDRVAVYNLAGITRVQAGSGSAVRVDVDVGGADGNDLRIESGPLGSIQALRVLYPDDRIVYPDLGRGSRSEIRVRDDGTFFDDHGGHRGRRVLISGSGTGMEAYANLTISVPAGRWLGVYLGVGEVTVSNVNGDLVVDVASAPVTASGTRGMLVVDTGSGSVDVRDAEGDVEVDTGSGSVDVATVHGDRLALDTGSGGVQGSDIEVRELDVETGSGSIELDRVAAPDIRLDTGSGSVRIELLRDVESLDIDTGSGGVTVGVPADLGAEITVETGSGGIDFEMPVTVTRFGRSELRGSLGDGNGLIRIDTGSGSVRLVRN